jgi:hypothetical protein
MPFESFRSADRFEARSLSMRNSTISEAQSQRERPFAKAAFTAAETGDPIENRRK